MNLVKKQKTKSCSVVLDHDVYKSYQCDRVLLLFCLEIVISLDIDNAEIFF